MGLTTEGKNVDGSGGERGSAIKGPLMTPSFATERGFGLSKELRHVPHKGISVLKLATQKA